jgi:hypothetical protein
MYPPSPTLDHLQFRRCFLLLPIFAAFLGCQLIVLPADENSSKSVPSLSALIERMAVDGRGFDPQPLLDQGVAGMRAVLDHIFPDTIVAKDDRRAEVKRLIEQLGDESFERREEADARLRQIGWSHAKLLREALEHKDPEVRFRVREVIRSWEEETTEQTRKMQATYTALQTYLEKLDDLPSQQELARRVALALGARLDQTIKAPALKICLQAMAQWKVDLVHEELLPLLKHEDPAVAIFAMRGIAGRTGNSYIAPIHMGAIACGRRELVKCGFRSMPCPFGIARTSRLSAKRTSRFSMPRMNSGTLATTRVSCTRQPSSPLEISISQKLATGCSGGWQVTMRRSLCVPFKV